MASYPDSVKSFTTKNAGETIQAAHINDQQDEITAIEAGLLNGTARVNSSGLSVTGPSTFASRPVMPPPDCALVFLASSHATASSADSTLAWTAQSILTNSSMHSTATNPERLIPQSTGLYQISAQVSVAGPESSVDYSRAIIIDSSAAVIAQTMVMSTVGPRLNVTGLKRFDAVSATAYVMVRYGSAGASTHSLSSGLGVTWASLTKL